MELCIFNKIEDDLCIKGILEKDNVIVLRNIIEFSETEGVTSSAIKEYVATRLANDDNILSRLAQAGKFIIEKDKASIGMLQRMFKIGFNRAARIMDQLADAGVVGEEEGTKPRKVLMSMEQFENMMEEGY